MQVFYLQSPYNYNKCMEVHVYSNGTVAYSTFLIAPNFYQGVGKDMVLIRPNADTLQKSRTCVNCFNKHGKKCRSRYFIHMRKSSWERYYRDCLDEYLVLSSLDEVIDNYYNDVKPRFKVD